MHVERVTTPPDPDLRAAWHRIQPRCTPIEFDAAMQMPAFRALIHCAARAFARPQPIDRKRLAAGDRD
jgi:hypothetical protein